jgi:integrase
VAPRTIGRLTPRRVSTAKPKAGRRALVIGDGGGLWLQVTRGEGEHIRRSWTFRYEINGKRREMGLGPLHTLGVADARAKAKALRQQLLDNVDPLEAREVARRAKLAEQARTMTLRQCAKLYLDLHQDGWKSAKHREQWTSSLKNYVFPVLGDLSVADIDPAAVMKVVQPLWKEKTVTASRVRGRIEAILDYASASGFRTGDNPARHVSVALPKKSTIAKVEHLAALPWREVPAFVADLRKLQGAPARGLEFLILTGVRTGEALGAAWDEIDRKTKTWTIPGNRMKAGNPHRVPLSARAVEILDGQRGGPYVFGGSKPLPPTALRRQALDRLRPDVTVHGFRASFKTWASESTAFPRDLVEVALAHKRGGPVEETYQRGDLFEKRRRLMQAWADYLGKPAVKAAAGSNVVVIKAEA